MQRAKVEAKMPMIRGEWRRLRWLWRRYEEANCRERSYDDDLYE